MNTNWSKARASYSYIPAKLVVTDDDECDFIWGKLRLKKETPNIIDWPANQGRENYSSFRFDEFHKKLLTESDSAENRLQGLCSAYFWGYSSGADGRIHLERALARVLWLRDGRNMGNRLIPAQNLEAINCQLKLTSNFVAAGKFGDALQAAMELTFFGMSFASKLIMFMSPESAVVYDDVIHQRLLISTDQKLRELAISAQHHTPAKKARAYEGWCDYCRLKAEELNKKNEVWCDWDNSKNAFRAVDIERAYFALGRQEIINN